MYEINKYENSMEKSIIKKFKQMGVRVKFREVKKSSPIRRNNRRFHFSSIRQSPNYRFEIDVKKDKKGEYFDILSSPEVDIDVVNIDVKDRHLLLNAKIPNVNPFEKPDMIKALCGHDERHWFSSQVNASATTIANAKDFLKPKEVVESQKRKNVKKKNWNKRTNDGYKRQGEWFFIPAKISNPNPDLILEKEPLVLSGRRGGKPHIARYAFRRGGDTVYIPNNMFNKGDTKIDWEERSRVNAGLTNDERNDFFKKYPFTKEWSWRPMTRNPELYVKGTIRHPDHKTITLRGWYKVIVNGEIRGANVVFLD